MRNQLTLQDIKRKYGERVYPLYKEVMHAPYMEHEKGGLQGALLTDGERVRCDECGKWYKSLAMHLSTHKMSSDQYKEARGLGKTTSLTSVDTSKRYREASLKRDANKSKDYMKSIRKLQDRTKIDHKLGRTTDQYRNKFGLCQEQMALRYAILSIECGKFVDPFSILEMDKVLWNNIDKFYGTFPKFFKAIGINPSKTNWKLPNDFTGQFDDKLISIARLRELQPNNDGNYTEKCVRDQLGDTHVNEIIDSFGSWRQAIMFAGLNSV